jgi:hypothetical protein
MNKALVNPIPPDPNMSRTRIDAPELDNSIVARPLVAPDFTNPKPKNSNVIFRWIEFKARDGFRFQQCLTQGYVVATINDLANPEKFIVYNKEQGTKFINGDVILMKIDRGRYLGALKYRHNQTQALSSAAVTQAVAKRAAQVDVSQRAQASGQMEVFAPGAGDLEQIGVNVSKIPGIGGTPGVDKASGTDIRSGK